MENNNNALLSELLKNSSMHGPYHIFTATGKITKCLWVILFLFGIGAFSFNLIFIIQRYLSNPIIIHHIKDSERFIWPTLTFCNPTAPFPLHQSPTAFNHWKETVRKSKDIVNILSSRTKLFRMIQDFNSTDNEFEETTITMSSTDPNKLLSDDFRSNILFYGYTVQHTGVYLVKEYSNSGFEIGSKELKKFSSTQYVQIRHNIPCYTLEIDKSEMLKKTDLNSIMFVIRFNYPSYQIFNSSYIFRSIFLYITHSNNIPHKDEILILPGFNNKLTIKQSRHYQHNTDKKVCRNEIYRVELYDAFLSSTSWFEGDLEDCRKIVSQKLFVTICKCFSPFLPIFKGDGTFPRLCLNTTIFSISQIVVNAECMVNVSEKYRDATLFDEIEQAECGKYRPAKCDELSYETEERKEMWIELWSNTFNDRRRQFIQENYQPLFNRHWINRDFLKEMRDDVAMLLIKRYSKFGDVYKEEFEYSISQLLSNIGGLMSLWLGLSVVGLFEILEFLHLMLLEECEQKRRKSLTTQPKSIELDNEKISVQFHPVDHLIPNYKPGFDSAPPCCGIHYCSSSFNETLRSENGYLFGLNPSLEPNKYIQSMISSF